MRPWKIASLRLDIAILKREEYCRSAERTAAFSGVMCKASKGGNPHSLEESTNRIIAKVTARVEHPFAVIKCQFGHAKTRYRGLAKNRAQLTLLALVNLFLMRRKLMA